MDNMEQNNATEQANATTLAEGFADFYGTFVGVVKNAAAAKGIELPNDFPEPDNLAKLSADIPEDLDKIISAIEGLITFVEEKGLRRHSTPEEMASFIDWQMAQGTPEAETLKKLARLQTAISTGLEVREQITRLMKFKQQEDAYLDPVYFRKSVINQVGEAIEKAGFPVDGKKLIRNYLTCAAKDPTKAYDMLINNPATFAPIVPKSVKEGGNKVDPEEGRRMNQKLGKFLKGFKL